MEHQELPAGIIIRLRSGEADSDLSDRQRRTGRYGIEEHQSVGERLAAGANLHGTLDQRSHPQVVQLL